MTSHEARTIAARVLAACMAVSFAGLLATRLKAEEPLDRATAVAALRKAVTFSSREVSGQGGYVWRYSADLKVREGESEATATTAWVQPPGTPTVGEAFLTAWERTGDETCREAAVRAGHDLVQGQLESGGWDYRIEFDPAERKRYAYRIEGKTADEKGKKLRNSTTLDDENTQSAVRFLMRLDRTLEQTDAAIHEAAIYALDRLVAAQYPNGAWPQRFVEPPRPEDFLVIKASYPAEWPRTWPATNYSSYYTLNDGTLEDMIAVMFEAAEIYGDSKYAEAARRGGDFLLLAQMPDPQPAWAQQYNTQMQPAWARKFEPPSVSGGESQGAIRILMEVYRQTGDRKYLEPIPRAIEYLKKSEISNGRLARFYELQTNKPLYFTKEYALVYTDDDLPTHYGFIVDSKIDRLRADYDKLLKTDPVKLKRTRKPEKYEMSASLANEAAEVVESLDKRGAWVEKGSLKKANGQAASDGIITTKTFIGRIDVLGRFIAASKN